MAEEANDERLKELNAYLEKEEAREAEKTDKEADEKAEDEKETEEIEGDEIEDKSTEGEEDADAAPEDSGVEKKDADADIDEDADEADEDEDAGPDESLRAEARALFTDAEIDALGDEKLRTALDAMDRLLIQEGKQDLSREEEEDEESEDEKETPPKKAAEEEAEEEADTAGDLELDEELLEPEQAKAFKALAAQNKALRESLERLSERLDGATKERESAEVSELQRQQTQWLDEQVGELGDEWADVFGQGTAETLDPKSDAWTARSELFDTIVSLRQGYARRGLKVPDDAALFTRALRALHGERMVKQAKAGAREELAKEAKKRTRQGVGRPSHKRGAPTTSDEEAVAEAREWVEGRDAQHAASRPI